MNQVFARIADLGIVPVVKIDDANNAVPLGKALIDGGLPVAEITFRTAAAEEVINNLTSKLPELLVGAGTVLNVDQARRAIAAGAKFIVSPGFIPTVVEYCLQENISITPGCSNPTDLAMAVNYGLEVVKFFPADSIGGLPALKAMSAPYNMLKFLPTGGVNAINLRDYLSFPKVIACGGSWMVKDEFIKNHDFAKITQLTSEAIQIMLGFDLAHVGINMLDAENALVLTKTLAEAFNLPLKEGSSSHFVGTGIEVIKGNGAGKNGHIAIKTNNINRAIAFMERKGIAVDMSTAKGPAEGPPVAVYLKKEYGGFAIHLLQNK